MPLLYQQPTIPISKDGLYTIPVLVVNYFPYRDGRVDKLVTGDVDWKIRRVRQHVTKTTEEVIRVLEKGSIYHGYKDNKSKPSLRYKIVDTLEYLEPLPTYIKPDEELPMTDYNAIMKRINAEYWVMEKGVKEIWLWGYDGNMIGYWTSNMSGQFGDISNSDRNLYDLPVFEKSYTVYHYNYRCGTFNAVYNHAVQVEWILYHLDSELFHKKFLNHCGSPSHPPNARYQFDYHNPKSVQCEIEDWQPNGSGIKQAINCTRWNGDELTWLLYWMQNLPGANSNLCYEGKYLTNWWSFIGDFDTVMGDAKGLIETMTRPSN